ncbi:MAG: threonine/serine exporter family protein [Gemmatimonadota bacterium]|nr:threonine/serine exporter family protein [Gemmatimonadota bacterium]
MTAKKSPHLIRRIRNAIDALRAQDTTPDPAGDDVPDMLGTFGTTLLAASQATPDVESDLHAVADAYGAHDLKFAVLPTLVFVSDSTRTTVFSDVGAPLRLDQIAALEQEVRGAARDQPPPGQVIDRIHEIRAAPPRFRTLTTIIGHTILTLGFGLVLNPTVTALPAYIVLGAIVGTIVAFGSRLATLSLILPVVTAFLVTLLTAHLLARWIAEDPLRIIAPPLASFLPGIALTIAAVELTRGQIIAGASRLVYGVAQLVLLAFGVYAGMIAVGHLPEDADAASLGVWAPWVGIVLTGIGYSLWASAPKGALPWVIAALAIAHGAQLLGNLVTGPELSGFLGALVVAPFARLAGRFASAPPAIVLTICGFWILVPGALGFIGVTEAAAHSSDAADTLFTTAITVIAIAIGMLVGSGLTRDLSAVRRAWRAPRQDA